MTSPRVRKVADRIQVIVAEMLERRIKDPRLGFVTITDVRVTGDTQNATIFYTVLGEEEQLAGTAAALESAKGLIRSEVGKQLGMRHVPTLEFIHDALPDTARHIDELLSQGAGVRRRRRGRVRGGGLRGRGGPLPQAATTLRRRARRRGVSAAGARRAGRGRQARGDDLARRRRPGAPAGRHPQGRPRRHPRPDGDRGAAPRRRPGDPAAGAPDLTEKAYDATIRLGAATTTDDAEGEVVSGPRRPATSARPPCAPRPPRFVGRASSRCRRRCPAMKVDGRRAYARVRAGENVELPARPVTVHELEVHAVRLGEDVAELDVAVPLQQRHLHPGPRPRPGRRARGRRSPDRAAPHRGRDRSASSDARTLERARRAASRCSTSRRGRGALLPVVPSSTTRRRATSASAGPWAGRRRGGRGGPGRGVRPDGPSWRSTAARAAAPRRWPCSPERVKGCDP